MTYNTGNALGSSDVRDLKDNAQNLDKFANGPDASYPDRFGSQRRSLAGIGYEFDAGQAERVVEFNEFLESSGYEVPIDYVAGLGITRPTQTVRFSGELYRAKDASLPFTTTTWAADSAKFFSIGDAALRQEIAETADATKGSAKIGRALQVVGTIADLRALSKASASKYALTVGYYSPGDGGGDSKYRLDVSDTTSVDNGGTIIVAADGGRWKLVYIDGVSIKQFGARGTWNGAIGADDTVAIQSAVNAGVRKLIVPAVPSGFSYQTTAPIDITMSVAMFGHSVETQLSIGTFQNVRGAGSWFHFNHPGRGFNIQRVAAGFQGVELRDIGTLRSHNVTAGTFVPTVYDYDVYASDCADLKIFNVCMLNPYKGLYVTNGQQGRVWIDKLYGQPIMTGILLKLTYDCPRLLNVNWWPYWSFHATVWAYHKLNTIGLNTWRADGLFIENYFSIFHRIGWQVSGDVTNGTTFKTKVTNMFLDNCAYGYFVDASARGHTATIVNLSIQMDPAVVDTGAKPVFVVPDSCDIDIVNLSASLATAEAVNVAGPYVRMSIHNPKIADWGKGGSAVAAIICGDVNSLIEVTGRKIFDLGGVNPIYAGVGKIAAEVGSGHFSGSTNASGDIVIPHNGRVAPTIAKMQNRSAASLALVMTASALNTITVRVYNTVTGAGLVSTPVTLDWQTAMG
jgi:hypothetical protein